MTERDVEMQLRRQASRRLLEERMAAYAPGDVVCWMTVNGLRYAEVGTEGGEKVVRLDTAHSYRLEDVVMSPSFRKLERFARKLK